MILLAIALAAQAPPLGWDIGNSFAKDVCSERNALASDAACYAAWRREIIVPYSAWRMDVCLETDALVSERACRRAWREMNREYAAGDVRCTRRYQIETRWQFYSDDRPNCPNLRRPRR